MRKAIADVWRKSGKCCINYFLCARWAVNVQRRFRLAHDVVRSDDIVDVGEVVAVKVSDQNSIQEDGQCSRSGKTHHYRAACVNQDGGVAGLYQGGRTAALWVWHWATCAEQSDVHVFPFPVVSIDNLANYLHTL